MKTGTRIMHRKEEREGPRPCPSHLWAPAVVQLLLRKKERAEIRKWKLCHRQRVPGHRASTLPCLFTEHIVLSAWIKESK